MLKQPPSSVQSLVGLCEAGCLERCISVACLGPRAIHGYIGLCGVSEALGRPRLYWSVRRVWGPGPSTLTVVCAVSGAPGRPRLHWSVRHMWAPGCPRLQWSVRRVWGPGASTLAVVCAACLGAQAVHACSGLCSVCGPRGVHACSGLCGCVTCLSRFCGEKGTGASLEKGLGPQPTRCIPMVLPVVTCSGCDFAVEG